MALLPLPLLGLLLLLLVAVGPHLNTTAEFAPPLYQMCPTNSNETNYTANSTFSTNLNLLLSFLPANGSATGFFSSTVGNDPDRVHGLVLCRGDVSAGDCQKCLDMAAEDIQQLCPFKRSAVIRNENCMLRYSNLRFFSTSGDSLIKVYAWNTGNLTEVDVFNRQLDTLMAGLVRYAAYNASALMFATGEADYVDAASPKIYGLVQCTRDQLTDDCSACLRGIIGEIPKSPLAGKRGGVIVKATCNIRYELYSFYKSLAMVSVPLSTNATSPAAATPQTSPAPAVSPPITSPATQADFVFQLCSSTGPDYAANSTFRANLDRLLSSLPASGSVSGYFNGSAGVDLPDRVYGLVLCRGDKDPGDCRSCLDTAAQEVLQLCPSKRSAVLCYDYCTLRYSDRRFSVDDDPIKVMVWNGQNPTEVTHFNRQLNLLMQRLVSYGTENRWTRMFVTGVADYNDPVNPKIYGLVQCAMYQSADDCNTCLNTSIGEMPRWAFGRSGARYLKFNCDIRYDVYPFYEGSPMVSVSLAVNATRPAAAPAAPLRPPIDTPAAQEKKKGTSTDTVLAIAIPVGVAFALILVICVCSLCQRESNQGNSYMRDAAQEITTIESLLFDLSTLRAATGNFSELNLLGKGGFGTVYKGVLPNGQEIAVKRLLAGSGQGVEELKNEVVLLAKLQHKRLVRLLGVCLEEKEKLLVYEYVPNRSLDKFLFDPAASRLLNWERRYKIICGIAIGLQYLHEDSQVKIIHRDLKAGNILLDAGMNPKISDFGLARLFPEDQTQASTTRVVGTFGYMAPEYVMIGQFSSKSDVFSFGVLVLEMVTGQRNTRLTTSGSPTNLLGRAWEHWRDGTVEKMIDPSLSDDGRRRQFQGSELTRCVQIGLLCVQEAAADRPDMSSVGLMLSSESVPMRVPSRPAFFLGQYYSQLPAADNRSAVSLNQVSVTELEPR